MVAKTDAAIQARLLESTRETLRRCTEETDYLRRNLDTALEDICVHRGVLRELLTEHKLLESKYLMVQNCYADLKTNLAAPEQKIQTLINEGLRETVQHKEKIIMGLLEQRGHSEVGYAVLERAKKALEDELKTVKEKHVSQMAKSALAVTKFLCHSLKNTDFHPEICTRSYRDTILNRLVNTTDDVNVQHLINSYVTNGSSNGRFDCFVASHLQRLPVAWYLREFQTKCPANQKGDNLHFFYFKTVECYATPSLIAFINSCVSYEEVMKKSNISRSQLAANQTRTEIAASNFQASVDAESVGFHEKLDCIQVDGKARSPVHSVSFSNCSGEDALRSILNPTPSGATSFNLPDFTSVPQRKPCSQKVKRSKTVLNWK